jgi:IclR family transcriptional regulator, pca regulon regulatory protein
MPRRPTVSQEPGKERHAYFIESLARGLAVLDAFGPERHELTLKEIAEAAQVTQPSALRIGYTLVQTGYLMRNPATRGYRLGPRALSAGLESLGSMTLPEIAEPYMVTLRDHTEELIKLAVPAGLEVVIVGRAPAPKHPAAGMYVGTRGSVLSSSLGRAVLAWQPEHIQTAVIAQAREMRLTPKTLPRSEIRREVERIRERGYALNDQGTTLDHRSVAAPILDASGKAVGAINLSMSVQRITLDELERAMAPQVVEAAAAISAVIPLQVQGAGILGG